ncbi:MAG: 50S ribosomal protein L24 [Acidobacteriota bacterium]
MRVRIVKGDQVEIISGREKGKRGKVLSVSPSKGRVLVEGVNFVKRHTRSNPQHNIKGGILEKEAPLAISTLMVVCSDCQKPTRLGAKVDEDGRKVRVCKQCGAVQS